MHDLNLLQFLAGLVAIFWGLALVFWGLALVGAVVWVIKRARKAVDNALGKVHAAEITEASIQEGERER